MHCIYHWGKRLWNYIPQVPFSYNSIHWALVIFIGTQNLICIQLGVSEQMEFSCIQNGKNVFFPSFFLACYSTEWNLSMSPGKKLPFFLLITHTNNNSVTVFSVFFFCIWWTMGRQRYAFICKICDGYDIHRKCVNYVRVLHAIQMFFASFFFFFFWMCLAVCLHMRNESVKWNKNNIQNMKVQ